jgi:uncharacterized protein YndB with AHSA1/START domain
MAAQSAVAAGQKPSLTIKRKVAAPPARCFRAWTDPKELKQWFGPPSVECIRAEADPRVGGRYLIVMRNPSGESHEVGGVFREVIADRKLVFTWAWRDAPEKESLVTVEFVPDGSATALTVTHEQFADADARDRHNQGWTGALDKFVAYVA